ncbi:Alpha/Beta hydrolase protein [Pavlovales sp. CCMP2436]|nr:Alpha/Beta hydrolase protein [Pavlovales sp. CCMP2436]
MKLESAKAVLIFLHGSGDSGPGVRSALRQVASGHFMATMRERGVEVVTPSADPRSYFESPLSLSSVWFDRTDMSPSAPEKTDSIEQSAKRLAALLDQVEQAGVPAHRIVVGGFSMGGGMALNLALREADRGLAGVFALSGYMCFQSPAFALASAKRLPPVYMRHGAADGFILPEWGAATADELRALGTSVDFALVPGLEHSLTDDEVVQLTEWVCQILKV